MVPMYSMRVVVGLAFFLVWSNRLCRPACRHESFKDKNKYSKGTFHSLSL